MLLHVFYSSSILEMNKYNQLEMWLANIIERFKRMAIKTSSVCSARVACLLPVQWEHSCQKKFVPSQLASYLYFSMPRKTAKEILPTIYVVSALFKQSLQVTSDYGLFSREIQLAKPVSQLANLPNFQNSHFCKKDPSTKGTFSVANCY